MILIRFFLIGVAVFLVIRSFTQYASEEHKPSDKREPGKKDTSPVKKVSKEIGEYVDYEELKK